jgi:hypothetical protein
MRWKNGEHEQLVNRSDGVVTAVFIAENDFFTGRCLDIDGGLRI